MLKKLQTSSESLANRLFADWKTSEPRELAIQAIILKLMCIDPSQRGTAEHLQLSLKKKAVILEVVT